MYTLSPIAFPVDTKQISIDPSDLNSIFIRISIYIEESLQKWHNSEICNWPLLPSGSWSAVKMWEICQLRGNDTCDMYCNTLLVKVHTHIETQTHSRAVRRSTEIWVCLTSPKAFPEQSRLIHGTVRNISAAHLSLWLLHKCRGAAGEEPLGARRLLVLGGDVSLGKGVKTESALASAFPLGMSTGSLLVLPPPPVDCISVLKQQAKGHKHTYLMKALQSTLLLASSPDPG